MVGVLSSNNFLSSLSTTKIFLCLTSISPSFFSKYLTPTFFSQLYWQSGRKWSARPEAKSRGQGSQPKPYTCWGQGEVGTLQPGTMTIAQHDDIASLIKLILNVHTRTHINKSTCASAFKEHSDWPNGITESCVHPYITHNIWVSASTCNPVMLLLIAFIVFPALFKMDNKAWLNYLNLKSESRFQG